MARFLFLSLILLLAACSHSGDPADLTGGENLAPDATVDTGPTCERFKVVGQPCDDDCECLGGKCLLNEYGPFRFCTRSCEGAAPGSPCAPESEGAPWTSLCVEFPADFRVQPARFCAPLCSSLKDCAALGAPWEKCEPPAWKGNPLYPAQPDQVCISPSAQGHEPIDPETCENWEGIFDEYPVERSACIKYCDFLATCQLLSVTNSTTCCSFHCMNQMIQDNKVDKEYFQTVRCYIDTYDGFTNTALVCTKPLEECGQEPDQP